jgi:hypothetical protein
VVADDVPDDVERDAKVVVDHPVVLHSAMASPSTRSTPWRWAISRIRAESPGEREGL